jgi:hypothetical protein
MDESGDEEFYEDFGAHLTAADCDRLLARARESKDRDFRLLVKQYLTLRRTAADALAFVETQYGERIPASTTSKGGVEYPLGTLRFLLEEGPKPG